DRIRDRNVTGVQTCALPIYLKLHDIPNTVKRAMFVLGQLGVDFTTIHAAGGSEMVAAGAAGLRAGAAAVGLPAPRLLAITQLTSDRKSGVEGEGEDGGVERR